METEEEIQKITLLSLSLALCGDCGGGGGVPDGAFGSVLNAGPFHIAL